MARHSGSGKRWLALAIAAILPAPGHAAPSPQVAEEPHARAEKKHDPAVKTSATRAPDTALLDWLGRYADAADGVDPLGFAGGDAGEQTANAAAPGEHP